MKFKKYDEVRSVTTGQVGKVIDTDYMYRVKNGDIQETKKYFIQWKDSGASAIWLHEYQLAHPNENIKTENEYIAELSTLEIQIDQSLINRDEETFKEYATIWNTLMDEMEIRGFIKQRRKAKSQ